jgi:hypothetical protein
VRKAKVRGRKPLDPENRNSELLNVRVLPSVRRNLERLANKHKQSVSREMQRAFDYWIEHSLDRPPHIETLGQLVMNLAARIERDGGKRWPDDRYTAEALGHGIRRLLMYFMPDADPLGLLGEAEIRGAKTRDSPPMPEDPETLRKTHEELNRMVGEGYGDMTGALTLFGSEQLVPLMSKESREVIESLGYDKAFRRLLAKNERARPPRKKPEAKS